VADPVSYEQELHATAADLDRLVRRLRLFTPRTWLSYRESIQDLLVDLVRIAGVVEGWVLAVPDVPDHVLADAVAVIGADLIDTLEGQPSEDALTELRASLSGALAATR
jgi:hypothetical protein